MEPEDHNNSPNEDVIGNRIVQELSDTEKQVQFRRQRQDYISEQLARKQQMIRLKKQQFGDSSSGSDQLQQSPRGSGHNKMQQPLPKVLPQLVPQVIAKTPSKGQILPQRLSINVMIKKGGQWIKQTVILKENSALQHQKYSYQAKTITKIKILAENSVNFNYKIKLNYHQTQVIFGIIEQTTKQQLPLSYYLFARIIKQRLSAAGWKLKQKNVQKIQGVPDALIKNAFIFGRIYKKSQVLGKWQERFIVINKDGIYSYRDLSEKHSMHIRTGLVKQLWSRFDIQDQLLVIKILNNSQKIQFGIPIVNFLNQNNWLFYFYKMMRKQN